MTMLSAITSAVLLAATTVSAIPHGSKDWWGPTAYSWAPTSTATAQSSGQTPFKFPLSNGFPNLAPAALNATEVQAQGTLPDGALPTNLTSDTITSFSLIAFNEIFEVAYFTDLVANITNNVPGYEIGGKGLRTFVLRTLTAVIAQEELHAAGANGILKTAGATPIQPCEYKFPVATFDEAITLAFTFTDLVLGTLQDVQNELGVTGDIELISLIGSVIGQEGEQNGYYRSLEGRIPSALPFLTRATREFAFSALNQVFVVPGSCPNENLIDLPIFGALAVSPSSPAPEDQTLQFTFTNVNNTDLSTLSLVYINQQNLPIVEPITNIQTSGQTVTFDAFFPYTENLLNSLTIAAVTTCAGPFTSADQVANYTLFGPGLIEIN